MRKILLLAGVLWGSLCVCWTSLLQAETIRFDMDQESVEIQTNAQRWEIGSRRDDDGKGIIEYVTGGEKIDSWSELVTVNYFKGLQGNDVVTRLLDFTKKGLESQCAEVIWETLSEDSDSTLYRWTAKACVGVADQSEIAYAVMGKRAFYVLHYANKKVPMPADKFQTWKENLKNASVQS